MPQTVHPESIKKLLDLSGSDKGKWYGGLYDVLLHPIRTSIRTLIEIGIGTPIIMAGYASEHYTTGASLRAWRDFLPNAQIHGLDVDPSTQIEEEERLKTHLCDSTDPKQVGRLLSLLNAAPDMIVDDGLHTKEAQIATLRNFYPALQPGGLYFVEDVWPYNVMDILAALNQLDPASPSFVDRSWGECVAIVIRKP